MRKKSIRFSQLLRKGNPLRWHYDIVIPNYGGRKHDDGSPSVRQEFVLEYMRDLFDAIDQAVEDIGGMSKRCRIFKKPRKKKKETEK